jgi:intracellular sulfur oxidation DsrE/DsrF family protein
MLCVASASWSQAPAADNKAALEGVKEMKIAFDITEGNPEALLAKLTVIDVTRKQLIAENVKPKLVLAFRGDASYFTQTDLEKIKPQDREAAKKVAAKLREIRGASGVESLEQCSLPLPARKLKGEEVMPEVKLVGNGWISLVSYQQKGYAYIAP